VFADKLSGIELSTHPEKGLRAMLSFSTTQKYPNGGAGYILPDLGAMWNYF